MLTFAAVKKIYVMRGVKIVCFVAVALLAVSVMGKKPKNKIRYGVYLAGVSASFTDSLVFFTNIQYLDSAVIDENGMLVGRAAYSYQLKDYLEHEEGEKNRTCFMFFNTKQKNLQKEIDKIKEKYRKGNSLVLLDVNPDFVFKKAEW